MLTFFRFTILLLLTTLLITHFTLLNRLLTTLLITTTITATTIGDVFHQGVDVRVNGFGPGGVCGALVQFGFYSGGAGPYPSVLLIVSQKQLEHGQELIVIFYVEKERVTPPPCTTKAV